PQYASSSSDPSHFQRLHPKFIVTHKDIQLRVSALLTGHIFPNRILIRHNTWQFGNPGYGGARRLRTEPSRAREQSRSNQFSIRLRKRAVSSLHPDAYWLGLKDRLHVSRRVPSCESIPALS